MQIKTQLDSNSFSKDCFVATYITPDEKTYIFEINYLDGKFVCERTFPNSREGVAAMEEFKCTYKCELDVRKHFGLI